VAANDTILIVLEIDQDRAAFRVLDWQRPRKPGAIGGDGGCQSRQAILVFSGARNQEQAGWRLLANLETVERCIYDAFVAHRLLHEEEHSARPQAGARPAIGNDLWLPVRRSNKVNSPSPKFDKSNDCPSSASEQAPADSDNGQRFSTLPWKSFRSMDWIPGS